jgi:hypothetical protein
MKDQVNFDATGNDDGQFFMEDVDFMTYYS